MRRMTAILTLILATVSIAACGGGNGSTPPTIIGGGITYFVVTASNNRDTVSILPGNPVLLSGVAYDAAFDPLALVGDTTWVSRDTTIASVNTHGVVTSIAVGSTWVVGSFVPKNSSTSYADSVFVIVVGRN
ncbi:MAG: hypothetical protein WBQ26_09540 [Gemmatimonadaceae bacterium]|nr:hypothetical protein [Gemmatimonadaceae bacterium]